MLGIVTIVVSGCAAVGGGAKPTAESSAAPNAEEARLSLTLPDSEKRVSTSMIEAGGLASEVAAFRTALKGAKADDIVDLAEDAGRTVWAGAASTAQGDSPEFPDATDEDRGLYWARLTMRDELRTWAAGDGDREKQLDDARDALELSSRGYDDASFEADGARHVMLSGFDPFGEWKDNPVLGNPSGSIALHLDGRTIETPSGPVTFEAVMLPVSWQAFDDGMVERAYAPVLSDGEADADLAVTVSQGGFEDFEIEQWAGAWRDGSPDNLDAGADQGFREEVPLATVFSQPKQNLQFIETTLPFTEMIAAATPAFAVKLNPMVCVAAAEDRADEGVTCDVTPPATDALAASGGGGAFLSNESMYRVNRLRLALGRDDIAGGHLHTPLPDYSDATETGTGPVFVAQRHALVGEAEALLVAGALAR